MSSGKILSGGVKWSLLVTYLHYCLHLHFTLIQVKNICMYLALTETEYGEKGVGWPIIWNWNLWCNLLGRTSDKLGYLSVNPSHKETAITSLKICPPSWADAAVLWSASDSVLQCISTAVHQYCRTHCVLLGTDYNIKKKLVWHEHFKSRRCWEVEQGPKGLWEIFSKANLRP